MIFIFALGLSSFYWLPVLVEFDFVSLHGATAPGLRIVEHFVNFSQPFQFTFFYDYTYDGTAFRMGLVSMILTTTAIVVVAREKRFLTTPRVFFALVVVTCYLLQFPFSIDVWEFLPWGSFVQFPWRLLALLALGMALTLGYMFAGINQGTRLSPVSVYVICLLCLLIIVPALKNLPSEPAVFEAEMNLDSFARWEEQTFFIGTTSSGEYLPIGVDRKELYLAVKEPGFQWTLLDRATVSRLDKVSVLEATPTKVKVRATAQIPSCLLFNVFYFPGWMGTVNGQATRVTSYGPLGLMRLCIPQGEHLVELSFRDTPVRTFSLALSIISAITLFMLPSLLYARRLWQRSRSVLASGKFS
jgi:hypothetical protein